MPFAKYLIGAVYAAMTMACELTDDNVGNELHSMFAKRNLGLKDAAQRKLNAKPLPPLAMYEKLVDEWKRHKFFKTRQ